MTLVQAIILGIVQGLTEFLPISSTAHLRVVPAMLGWSDPGAAFSAVIQLGTLLAVLIYFYRDIVRIATGTLRGPGNADGKLGLMIAVGTIPVVILGLLFKHNIETNLRSLYVIASATIGLAVVLVAAEFLEKRRQRLRGIDDLGWVDAVVVGCAQ